MTASLTPKRQHIPPELRPDWRTAELLVALSVCHGRRASLLQLHVVMWALRSEGNVRSFIAAYESLDERHKRVLPVRFDPAVDRAAVRASALGLIERRPNGALALTNLGGSTLEALLAAEALADVIAYASRISGRVTEARIMEMLPASEAVELGDSNAIA